MRLLHAVLVEHPELLFRRLLLEKTGLFDGKWASYGDLAWQMRATLNTCKVHIPEKLSSWRIHPAQASRLEKAKGDRRKALFVIMVDEFLDYSLRVGLPSNGGLPERVWQWALIMALALGFVGSLFYFVDWGVFSGGQGFAEIFWGFGAFAFATGITGTKLGLPAYWAWMGFVYIVSSAITYAALTFVFFGVVTALAILARLAGRDRLHLRPSAASTFWHMLDGSKSHNPEKQF